MVKSVSIQGIKGSFHHIVSNNIFGNDVNIVECMTFDETVDCVLNGETEVGLLAIENSIVGSIIPNYSLIDTNDLFVIGEYYLPISHNLMVYPGQEIKDIEEVFSHPMALLQCKKFLRNYPHIKLVEDKDTAEVARRIADKKLKGVAAISSGLSADLYGLEILAHDIQTIKENETRFVVVRKKDTSYSILENVNKASMKFELDHKRGSLAAILNVLSDCKLNLTKIQSLPKLGVTWKYSFFVDVTFQIASDFEKAKSILEIMTEDYKVLGAYKNVKHANS